MLTENAAWFCFRSSSWIPRGNYVESNRDDCTVSLIYAVHLKKSGYVSFEYQYVDNNIFFEFFVRPFIFRNLLFKRHSCIIFLNCFHYTVSLPVFFCVCVH